MRHVEYVLRRHIRTAAMSPFTKPVCIAESATTAVSAVGTFVNAEKMKEFSCSCSARNKTSIIRTQKQSVFSFIVECHTAFRYMSTLQRTEI